MTNRGVPAAALPAALAPIAGTILALMVLVGAIGPDLAHAVEESGWVGLLLFPLSAGVAVVSGVLVYFAGRGVPIPSVIALGCAGLPWLAGDAGLRWSAGLVAELLPSADSSSLGLLAARGLSEALWCRVLGASLAAGTIGGTALGLAIAALACAAAGDDARGRSGPLAAAAAVGVALALFAATIAVESASTSAALAAIPNADPTHHLSLLVRGAAGASAAEHARTLGLPVALLAVLATAGWAVARRRPSPGAILGGAALGLGALSMIALDALAASASSAHVGAIAGAWWLERDDVRPVPIDVDYGAPRSADLVLRADGAIAWDGRAVAATPAALEPIVREALARSPHVEQEGEWPSDLRPEHASWAQAEPSIVVAPDASAGVVAWRALIDAASRAGARSIVLEGVATDASEGAWRTVRELRARPFFGAALPTRTHRSVLLESALPDGFADRDEVLWHATIDAHGEVSPRPRAEQPMRWDPASEGAVYLSLGDAATSESIARALGSVEGDVVLVSGAVPGHPERPVAASP